MKIAKNIVVWALLLESRIVLALKNPKVICIVGSVGKTTTKDIIATVLSKSLNTRKSDKSYNSEIGVPLTVLNLENKWNSFFGWASNILKGFFVLFDSNYPDFLVIELGVDTPGDIAKLGKILSPDYIVFTSLPKYAVHAEFFPSVENLFLEKLSIVKYAKPNAKIIANKDDAVLVDRLSYLPKENIVWYSANDYEYCVEYKEEKVTGISIKSKTTSNHFSLASVIGKQFVYPFAVVEKLAALLQIPIPGDVEYFTAPGRSKLFAGIKNTTIIDDSYNASPFATMVSLENLRQLKTKSKKIVALGDMLELSPKEKSKAHKEILNLAFSSSQEVILVGDIFASVAKGTQAKCFKNSIKASDYLSEVIEKGDIILVKGSQSTRMEKIVAALLVETVNKVECLPRQEDIWNNR